MKKNGGLDPLEFGKSWSFQTMESLVFFCPGSTMETSRKPTKIAKGRNQPLTQIELINVKHILSKCLTLSGL